MNQDLKQRLVGAIVLVVLGIIVLPLVLEKPEPVDDQPDVTDIPVKHDINSTSTEAISSTNTIPPEVIARYEGNGSQNVQDELQDQEVDRKIVDQQREDQKTDSIAVNQALEEDNAQNNDPVINKASNTSVSKVDTKSVEKNNAKQQWALQIASFSSKENADRLVNRLKTESLAAYSEGVPTDGKTIYRVRIGPIDSKDEIEKLKKKIDQKEQLQTLIVTLE